MSTNLTEDDKEKIEPDQMRKILDELTREGLVERDGDSYRISQKGRETIELKDFLLKV